MNIFFWALAFAMLGGIAAALLASLFLILPRRAQAVMLPSLVCLAAGALLGVACLELLPHAFEFVNGHEAEALGMLMLAVLVAAFALDRLLRWLGDRAKLQVQSAGPLMLIGDGLHKLIDGLIIGVATAVDWHLGLVTALAVLAHEVPHELSNLAVLRDSGFSRARAFVFNLSVSALILPGALAGVLAMELAEQGRPWFLVAAAAVFFYTALSALVPRLHQQAVGQLRASQLLWIAVGIALVSSLHHLLH